MKILILTWEYPPRIVGGLSNHVYNLAGALSRLGHEIHVLTCSENDLKEDTMDNKVHVHRIPPLEIENEDFVKWTMHMNFALIEEGINLISSSGGIDIIHAHDWLVCYTAKVLKGIYNIPVVTTMHATEYGRNDGIRNEMQRYISNAEKYLVKISDKIIVCSNYMRNQVRDILGAKHESISVLPNGVSSFMKSNNENKIELRRRYAEDCEKIIFFIGRHVFEKGIQVLIEAIPRILEAYTNVKFIIAGSGPMEEELKDKVMKMGLSSRVLFTGYMTEMDRQSVYSIADAAVFPSLYEPFGIVALEAMASECPVVVSDTGGLSEIVEHGVNGLKTEKGSSDGIAKSILTLLLDEALCNKIKAEGATLVSEKYSWEHIAEETEKIYKDVN